MGSALLETVGVDGDTGPVHRFEATLEAAAGGPGCGIRLPFDPKAAFGTARAPVRVSVNNGEPFRTTVFVYGGVAWVGLRRDQQDARGVGPGDAVVVQVERDDTPREVEVPAELGQALAGSPAAAAVFDGLSFTHRKEYARWVGEAKRPQTRLARASRAVTMLVDGVRSPG